MLLLPRVWRLLSSLFLIAVDFLRNVLRWFNEKENSSITSNLKEILVGAATDNDIKFKKKN